MLLQEPHFKDLGVSADEQGLQQPQQTQQQQVDDSRVQLMSSLPSVSAMRLFACVCCQPQCGSILVAPWVECFCCRGNMAANVIQKAAQLL
jgi:hypothetical protein